MAQGTAGGMQFLTTACSTHWEHAGLLQGILLVPLVPLPQCMCRSLCSHRNCISSDFPFLAVSADSVFLHSVQKAEREAVIDQNSGDCTADCVCISDSSCPTVAGTRGSAVQT